MPHHLRFRLNSLFRNKTSLSRYRDGHNHAPLKTMISNHMATPIFRRYDILYFCFILLMLSSHNLLH